MNARHALTRNQDLVLSALNGSEAPLSAYAILDRLRDDGMRAPLQIYRALDKLIALGLVHRLESLNAFVACAHRHADGTVHVHGSTAFAICDECGQVEEFSDDIVEQRLEGWASGNRFKLEKTTVEMRGVCAACLAH